MFPFTKSAGAAVTARVAEAKGDPNCLNCLPHGVEARVVGVKGASAVSRRLLEMGVVPGAPVRVIKAAPLGDPLEVRIHSYHLALRRNEAQAITVVASDE
ncbi:MAG TPA: ferrous iron transport protein A [Pyrinomonadaceae bacterium]|nr:ferrous iron transport protein A [Pyrinomonadaceae bacterium]